MSVRPSSGSQQPTDTLLTHINSPRSSNPINRLQERRGIRGQNPHPLIPMFLQVICKATRPICHLQIRSPQHFPVPRDVMNSLCLQILALFRSHGPSISPPSITSPSEITYIGLNGCSSRQEKRRREGVEVNGMGGLSSNKVTQEASETGFGVRHSIPHTHTHTHQQGSKYFVLRPVSSRRLKNVSSAANAGKFGGAEKQPRKTGMSQR